MHILVDDFFSSEFQVKIVIDSKAHDKLTGKVAQRALAYDECRLYFRPVVCLCALQIFIQ